MLRRSCGPVPRFVLAFVVAFQNIAVFWCHAERAYPEGCSQFEASYSDYDRLEWPPPFCQPLLSANDYWLTRRLGTGKFSDVFEAIQQSKQEQHKHNPPDADDKSQQWVVLKCLKPVAERKVRRELLVLHRCATLVHLARLEGLVLQSSSSDDDDDSVATTTTVTLVLQHAGREAQWLCHPVGVSSGSSGTKSSSSATLPQPDEQQLYLSDYEIRYFLGHLLLALDDLHRAGIMHRDTKPRNVLINRSVAAAMPTCSSSTVEDTAQTSPPPLMLIDLGLADFYHPGCPYNVRVASRHYKAPELLVGWEYYDSAVDLWGFGCMLAGLLLRREPLFRGRDNLDQLGKIVQVLGATGLRQFVRRHRVTLTPEVEHEIWQRDDSQTTESPSYSPRQALLALAAAPTSSHHRPTTNVTSMEDPSSPTTAPRHFHIPSDGLDLVEHLLVYDPEERWTARQAWEHPYFDVVRERVQNEVEVARQQLLLPP